MEARPTKMLKFPEVMEDLGVSQNQLQNLVELGIFNPIYLGKGWKFSQKEILDFQRDYAGLDVSNYEKAKSCKEIVESQSKGSCSCIRSFSFSKYRNVFTWPIFTK